MGIVSVFPIGGTSLRSVRDADERPHDPPDEAAEGFRRGLVDVPADPRTRLDLAQAYAAMGLYADARREAARVLETAKTPALMTNALEILSSEGSARRS